MKKLPYWLKGGLILGTIFLITPILSIITSFIIKDSWRGFIIILIRVSLFPVLQLMVLQADGPPVASLLVIIAVINVIFWFLIGCLMGWIIGKIKRKNIQNRF